MSGQITEEMIRALCTPQSFERGQEYYSSGAVYQPARQGSTLTGICEGSSAPFYRLQVELDETGVRSALCTCPYEFGGFCKHIVALLLAYLYEPEEFIERPAVTELLADLDRETLVKLLAKTAVRDPDLYDWLAIEVQAAKASSQEGDAPAKGKRKTQVSAKTYERRVKSILHSLDGYRMSEAYWMMDGMVDQLQEVVDTADTFLEAGDAQGAILILMILLEEVANSYEQFDDSDGTLGEFLSEIGQPLAEAILSAELSEVERQKLSDDLEPVVSNLSDYGIDGLGVALAALEQGWAQPEKSQDWEEDEEEWDAEDGGEWYGEADLTQARLNVLERQGRIDEYLELCRQAGEHLRLALKLLESGRKEEALIIAMNRLASAPEALAVAQKLRELGHVQDALAVGEQGLSLVGEKFSLGKWLGPLEEVQGRIEPAVQAYLAAFASVPSLELYQAVIRLAGSRRKDLRMRMMDILEASSHSDTLVNVYLFEENWDAAIQVADQVGYWSYSLIEKVADAVLPHRPEWVIRVSIQQAQGLIEKTQSKYYPVAARWLAKAKKAYLETGRQKEWQDYLTNLKTTYARRPALQAALRQL